MSQHNSSRPPQRERNRHGWEEQGRTRSAQAQAGTEQETEGPNATTGWRRARHAIAATKPLALSAERRPRSTRRTELANDGDRRGTPRTRTDVEDAAIERIVQRAGSLSEFSEAQIRQIAAIALIATAVDDVDRQKRDDIARDHRRRLRALGRE